MIQHVSMEEAQQRAPQWSRWQHKGGGTYTVTGHSIDSTNAREGEIVILYVSDFYQRQRHRAAGEFLDGRFTRIEPGP